MQTIKSPLYVELFKIVVINPLLLVSRKTDGSSSMMTQTKTPKAQLLGRDQQANVPSLHPKTTLYHGT